MGAAAGLSRFGGMNANSKLFVYACVRAYFQSLATMLGAGAKLGKGVSHLTDASIKHSCSDIWWSRFLRLQTVLGTAKLSYEPSVVLNR